MDKMFELEKNRLKNTRYLVRRLVGNKMEYYDWKEGKVLHLKKIEVKE